MKTAMGFFSPFLQRTIWRTSFSFFFRVSSLSRDNDQDLSRVVSIFIVDRERGFEKFSFEFEFDFAEWIIFCEYQREIKNVHIGVT